MTPGDEILALLHLLAEQSGEKVSPERLKFTFDRLDAIGHHDQVSAALEVLLEKSRRFPTVAEVKELLGLKPPSPEDKGREVADRIYQALSKPWEAAKRDEFVGPIGAEVVRLNGGWQRLGENVLEAEVTIHKAQWRETAANLARKGGLGAAPTFEMLPEAKASVGLLDDQIKALTEKCSV